MDLQIYRPLKFKLTASVKVIKAYTFSKFVKDFKEGFVGGSSAPFGIIESVITSGTLTNPSIYAKYMGALCADNLYDRNLKSFMKALSHLNIQTGLFPFLHRNIGFNADLFKLGLNSPNQAIVKVFKISKNMLYILKNPGRSRRASLRLVPRFLSNGISLLFGAILTIPIKRYTSASVVKILEKISGEHVNEQEKQIIKEIVNKENAVTKQNSTSFGRDQLESRLTRIYGYREPEPPTRGFPYIPRPQVRRRLFANQNRIVIPTINPGQPQLRMLRDMRFG